MIQLFDNVKTISWIETNLSHLNCEQNTKSYLIDLIVKQITNPIDLSKNSIVLAYDLAKNGGNFIEFQQIGDWVIWSSSMIPKFNQNYKDLYENIGRLSYYSCYKLLRGSWKLYEELADELPRFIDELQKIKFI